MYQNDIFLGKNLIGPFGRLCVCILFGKVTEKNHKRSPYQKVEIFIQKLNINGLHSDIQILSERYNLYIQKVEMFIQKLNINGLHSGIQILSERYNFYIQKVEYIENLDFIGESYRKK